MPAGDVRSSSSARGAELFDHHAGIVSAGGLAAGSGLHARSDGSDRSVLEAGLACAGREFELVLANAAHIKNVPGRKSDVNDATWIADLLAHGLIRASFVPPGPIQELRDLTRTRKQLVREVVRHKQRIQQVLEDANVKLGSVVSATCSGRAGGACCGR